jgi:hypothetical protein
MQFPGLHFIFCISFNIRRGHASLLFAIFFDFPELGFFFAKQLFDHAPLRGIGHGLEHFTVMLDILSLDETFHHRPPKLLRR